MATQIYEPTDPEVVSGKYDIYGWTPKERRAQAKRIKDAAMDLYLAVKSSMPYLNETIGPCDEGCECILHDLNAALAKAEGRG